MGLRRQARDCAVQFIYLAGFISFSREKEVNLFWENLDLVPEVKTYAMELATGTVIKLSEIDTTLSKFVHNWDLDRIAAVDLAILRVATYELMDKPDVPVKVIINEAIELAKCYSTFESGKFVNGILDKIKSLRNENQVTECTETTAIKVT